MSAWTVGDGVADWRSLPSLSFGENQESYLLYHGHALDMLRAVPSDSLSLVVTSPPYNINKDYEKKSLSVHDYIRGQSFRCIPGYIPDSPDQSFVLYVIASHQTT